MRLTRLLALSLAMLAGGLSGCADSAGASAPPSIAIEGSGAPAPSDSAPLTASPTPTASQTPTPDPARSEIPTRVAVPGLKIDLPVVAGDLAVKGNPPDYPLCDVAQYLTTYRYPGRLGTTTWIYGHARDGMFLPLLDASEVDDGASLIGEIVHVWSDGNRRYTYRITSVERHATDRSAAADVPVDGGRLVLQTSEGPRGTVPKLQVVAEPTEVQDASAEASTPRADPRVCYEP